ncbi:hypothetical protein [Dactylosporangium sp. CA-092794]|uniref:hypothetical protein n=1 Tax=Dactylosporangium sp. CA-092794 TaxID=3239929 RepID=UPI003D8AA742
MNAVADLEVVLDVRRWPDRPQTPADFEDLWAGIEAALFGCDLADRPVYSLQGPQGELHVRLARVRPGSSSVLTVESRVQIVSVLEAPTALTDSCADCARQGIERYGPFQCAQCRSADPARRLCDNHAEVLDGALLAHCAEHRPACVECGSPGHFRCAGDRCATKQAHCSRHRVVHPNDPDLSYCPTCYAEEYPTCEQSRCRSIGSVRCEASDQQMRPCGIRICPEHAGRWQVFGGESMGLGLCARHKQGLGQLRPEEVLRQIIVGTSLRAGRPGAEPLPSLRGFAFSLRKLNHYQAAGDYAWILATAQSVGGQAGSGSQQGRKLQTLVNERLKGTGRLRRTSWSEELAKIKHGNRAGGEGDQLVVRLRELVAQRIRPDGEGLAAQLRLADYVPSRKRNDQMQPALLFVHVEEPYRARFRQHQRYFADQLSDTEPNGLRVRIEGDQPAGRR